MALFDTHVHYNLEPLTSGQPQPFLRLNSDINLDKSWLDHAKTALNAGVEFSLIPGTNLETSQLAVHQVAESRNFIGRIQHRPRQLSTLRLAFIQKNLII